MGAVWPCEAPFTVGKAKPLQEYTRNTCLDYVEPDFGVLYEFEGHILQ